MTAGGCWPLNLFLPACLDYILNFFSFPGLPGPKGPPGIKGEAGE